MGDVNLTVVKIYASVINFCTKRDVISKDGFKSV